MSQFLCIGDQKMAESKGSLIAKSVSKHAGRAKEKLLQNLGKVDRTADEIFDDDLTNFNKQQNAAARLQKEFNNYIRCVRAVQTASKSLLDAINEMYEPQWTGHDLFYVQTQHVEMLWNDLSHKLGDQVLIPLNTYQAQFPEMRKKIDKRGRKLVDFDNCRHNLQSLQTNSALKKKDEMKATKAKEQLDEAKRTYDQLNTELHDELPALHDSRVLFLVNNLQTMCSAEHLFHAETAKVYAELEAIVDKLANDSQRNSYTLKKPQQISSPPKTLTNSTINISAPSSPISNDSLTTPSRAAHTPPASLPGAPAPPSTTPIVDQTPTSPAVSEPTPHNGHTPDRPESAGASSPPPYTASLMNGATTDNLPAGVLYRVKATYKYTREDVDELSFDVGEIIRVVEYDDPEEQEEGWLMGIKESSGEKGMFPANFTRPL
uniref:Amphiphysin n=1 Tax=Cacopsylla melanoneura TaxID=428564 RepID=A0A8D8U3W2_9HEMI